MRHFAIVGSGPAGFYTAEALAKAYDGEAKIDILDRYAVPYGLIRFGVAPDHQSLKAVSKRYDKVAEEANVRFVGNVIVGEEVSVDDLRRFYDAVIFATGAPHDRKLGIPGEDLPGVVGSAEFVGWYNGHPEFTDLDPPLDGTHAAVIGNGNVALDCARILSKTAHEFEGSDITSYALGALNVAATRTITIVGRRGPHQIAMTPKELGELGHLEVAAPFVDPADLPSVEADEALEPGHRKSITLLRGFAANPPDGSKPKTIVYDFFARPVRIEGEGRAERLIVERTRLDEHDRAIGTGETYEIPATLIVTSIGYSTPPMHGVPYDEKHGRYLNDHGQIDDQLWCVGWARRGPTGTIGTNRPDGYEVAEEIAREMPSGTDGGKPGGDGLDKLLEERGIRATSFTDWRTIEAAEEAQARVGSPREKMVKVEDWLATLDR